MPRPEKLREPGDTRVRKAWNKKKTHKYTIAITLDEKKEKRRKRRQRRRPRPRRPRRPARRRPPPRSPARPARPPARESEAQQPVGSQRAGMCPQSLAQATPAERSTTAPSPTSVVFSNC